MARLAISRARPNSLIARAWAARIFTAFVAGASIYEATQTLWPLLLVWVWPQLLAGVAAVIVLGAWWLWWGMPKQQADRLRITDAKTRGDAEDNFRKTAGQLIGGAAVLVGAGVAYLQFTQQQQAAHDLLISNQVAKGFELLGNKEKISTLQLGGVYALEGVMNSSEQYHEPVLEALCAFIRDQTRTLTGDDAPAVEIQAALTAIGRRKFGFGTVNLSRAHLPKAIFFSHFEREGLFQIEGANFAHAYFFDADLRGAELSDANLSGTVLRGADLSGAILLGTHLSGTNLSGANLSGAEALTQGQLDVACGDKDTKLDPPLKIKPCKP